jgi:hypothetical protein
MVEFLSYIMGLFENMENTQNSLVYHHYPYTNKHILSINPHFQTLPRIMLLVEHLVALPSFQV